MLILSAVICSVFCYYDRGSAMETVGMIICYIQAVAVIISLFLTENALKKKFFADAKRK